jgi:hypothetical protein
VKIRLLKVEEGWKFGGIIVTVGKFCRGRGLREEGVSSMVNGKELFSLRGERTGRVHSNVLKH